MTEEMSFYAKIMQEHISVMNKVLQELKEVRASMVSPKVCDETRARNDKDHDNLFHRVNIVEVEKMDTGTAWKVIGLSSTVSAFFVGTLVSVLGLVFKVFGK